MYTSGLKCFDSIYLSYTPSYLQQQARSRRSFKGSEERASQEKYENEIVDEIEKLMSSGKSLVRDNLDQRFLFWTKFLKLLCFEVAVANASSIFIKMFKELNVREREQEDIFFACVKSQSLDGFLLILIWSYTQWLFCHDWFETNNFFLTFTIM